MFTSVPSSETTNLHNRISLRTPIGTKGVFPGTFTLMVISKWQNKLTPQVFQSGLQYFWFRRRGVKTDISTNRASIWVVVKACNYLFKPVRLRYRIVINKTNYLSDCFSYAGITGI